jgi:anti-sigma factor RsiW
LSARASCPPEVLGLLPWYPEGALGDAERGRVEAHAAACAACRRELALIEGSAEPETGTVPDRELLWARTLARIAQGDRSTAVALAPEPRARGWRVPMAAAAGVLIALGAGLWAGQRMRGDVASGREYQTANIPAQRSGAPELDVVFQPDASAEHIGAALRAIGGGIVSGPSPVSGIYRVRLGADADATRAAAQLRDGVASFAEPAPQ